MQIISRHDHVEIVSHPKGVWEGNLCQSWHNLASILFAVANFGKLSRRAFAPIPAQDRLTYERSKMEIRNNPAPVSQIHRW
jgi:hypothetical protein